MQLSVVVIMHEMRREAMRTLRALSPGYQHGMPADQFEVVVVENGSRDPLDADEVRGFGKNFKYHYLENPPPSPGFAINFGVGQARAEVVCVMIDGACILSPGVLSTGLRAFRVFPNAVVLTRYFYLGPEIQNRSTQHGYNKVWEDELLASIDFPNDGYRLFEIASPLPAFMGHPPGWFNRIVETCCLFFHKTTFEQIGGCDLRFDIAGGGLLNHDLYFEMAKLEGTTLVQLLGEGTFHQVHGGTTTNTTVADKDAKVAQYKRQYKEIRGVDFRLPRIPKPLHFLGSMRSRSAARMQHTLAAEWERRKSA